MPRYGSPLGSDEFETGPRIRAVLHDNRGAARKGRPFSMSHLGPCFCLIALPRNWISLFQEILSEGSAMISTLKVRTSGTESLIEKIKAEITKRAEAKAKRMFLRRPKRLAKR